MPLRFRFLSLVRNLFHKSRVERELNDEVRSYVQILTDEKIKAGMNTEEARRAAMLELGGVEQVKEQIREVKMGAFLESLLHDLRFGLRSMRRSPGLTAVAVLSLALGIGANTAIFSLMNAVMLRQLPVKDPGRLVLFGKGTWGGNTDTLPDGSWQLFSFPFYREVQQKNQVFSGVTAILSIAMDVHGTIGASGNIEPMNAQLVSGTYFSVLGVKPALGRTFTPADDEAPGGHPVAVVSDDWWRQRFGRDPSIVGKKVTIGSTVYTIIGVTPPGFFGTTVDHSTHLWIPISMEKQVSPGWNGLEDKRFQSNYILARLKPGVSIQHADANVNLLFKQALHEFTGPQPTRKQVQDIAHARIDLTSAATGLSHIRFQFSKPLQVLMAVVVLVLLIACANIANLLLARATTRNREIAVRQALGAGRMRLVRQLLTESLLLALIGGALGVALASLASRLLLMMVSTGPHPLPLNVSPDASVLVFTFVLTLLTAVLFGTAPALRATQIEIVSSLKERGASSAQARSPLGKVLIVSQVGLSLVLLAGSGLFLRSLVNLSRVDTGFDKQNVLEFHVDEASVGYKEDARVANLYRQIEQRVAAQPGIRAASFSFFTFNQGEWTGPVSVQGQVKSVPRDVVKNVVGSGYFQTMGIPLLVGRVFGPQDLSNSQKVAVINQTMARTYFPNESPIGRRFGDDPEHAGDIEVIGVVKNAKFEGLQEKPHAALYIPYSQHIQYLNDFEVRYSGDPHAIIAEVRRAIGDIDRTLPVSGVTTLAAEVDDSIVNQRLVAQLSTFFGLLAVFLACIGIYGLMSYAVTRRTNEIGIRMALGARQSNVLWLVMKDVVILVGIGLAVGVPAALAGGRLVSNMLFGLAPADPLSLLAAVTLLLAVALLAGYLPARRASRVDPTVALRYE